MKKLSEVWRAPPWRKLTFGADSYTDLNQDIFGRILYRCKKNIVPYLHEYISNRKNKNWETLLVKIFQTDLDPDVLLDPRTQFMHGVE